jgi:O-antigen ligase
MSRVAPAALTAAIQSGDAARYLLVFAVFCIPLPTAWLSISLGLFVIGWLASGDFAHKWRRVRANPSAYPALLFFLLLLLGASYSSGEAQDIADRLYRYAKLLYIPMIIAILVTDVWRARVLRAFMLGMGLSLLLSYVEFLRIIPPDWLKFQHTGFKNHIAYSFLLAYFIYLLAQRWLAQRQWHWGLLSLLALVNMFLINTGRTGQVISLVLLGYLSLRYWRWKGALALLTGGLLLFVLLFYSSPHFHARLNQAMDQIRFNLQAQPDPADLKLQSYYRLFMQKQTLSLIGANPLFGTGTGSMKVEYAKLMGERDLNISENPHNEYLNIAVQLGLVGLAAFLLLLWQQWRTGHDLPAPWNSHQRALLITLGVGALFNSLLMDHSEGHFFVLMAGVFLSAAETSGRAAT